MGKLCVVKISEIVENPVALRNVNRESEDYLGLVDSIKTKGFFGAITVRQKEIDGDISYELIDGLHRFTASKDAGIEEINVDIVDLDDDQVLEAQIMANIHKIETKPMEYSQQLLRILTRNPLMTEAELANKLAKSSAWVRDRLSLNRIDNEKIIALVDEGRINLSNAYALAKLPAEEMANFVDSAITQSPDEFVPKCAERMREIRSANRKGRDAKPVEFTPVAFLQKTKDIKEELEKGAIARVLIDSTGATTAEEGFKLCNQWILHLDPESIAVQEAKWNEQQELKKKKKAERDAKRKADKAEKAAKEAADAEAIADENTQHTQTAA